MDDDHLRQIERLAGDVLARTGDEGRLDQDPMTPLRHAVVAPARRLRHEDFAGDGCTGPTAAVCRRWIGPITRAPSDAAGRGLGGR